MTKPGNETKKERLQLDRIELMTSNSHVACNALTITPRQLRIIFVKNNIYFIYTYTASIYNHVEFINCFGKHVSERIRKQRWNKKINRYWYFIVDALFMEYASASVRRS